MLFALAKIVEFFDSFPVISKFAFCEQQQVHIV